MKSENHEAVASALTCLRLFGIDLPVHPTQEQVQTEYDTVWETLDTRPIESLIDLPLMTDPEMQAAMQVLSAVGPPAYLTDFRLCCFQACCIVKFGMQRGTIRWTRCGASRRWRWSLPKGPSTVTWQISSGASNALSRTCKAGPRPFPLSATRSSTRRRSRRN